MFTLMKHEATRQMGFSTSTVATKRNIRPTTLWLHTLSIALTIVAMALPQGLWAQQKQAGTRTWDFTALSTDENKTAVSNISNDKNTSYPLARGNNNGEFYYVRYQNTSGQVLAVPALEDIYFITEKSQPAANDIRLYLDGSGVYLNAAAIVSGTNSNNLGALKILVKKGQLIKVKAKGQGSGASHLEIKNFSSASDASPVVVYEGTKVDISKAADGGSTVGPYAIDRDGYVTLRAIRASYAIKFEEISLITPISFNTTHTDSDSKTMNVD